MPLNDQRNLPSIPLAVWVIGLVALLVNLSSVMIYSLSPLYLTHVLGLSVLYLGILEGVIEFTAWSTRIFAGVISDFFRKRKPILILAYVLIFITRPIFALGGSVGWIYTAKIIDRFSNGIQATPREALVGDIAPDKIKGTCYGLRQSLAVIGSVLGAVLVTILMRVTDNNYQLIFWISSLPLLLAIPVLALMVRENVSKTSLRGADPGGCVSLYSQIKKIGQLNRQYWTFILIAAVFMISNYGSTYRIIQAEKLGFLASDIAVIMIIQNLGVMLASFPIGRLSDRIDRRLLLGIGFVTTILSNVIWGLQDGKIEALIAIGLWGIQMGITQSLMTAMIADIAAQELRGTAFGIYYFVTGVALFVANSMTGFLIEWYGPAAAFAASSLFALAGVGLLPLLSSKPSYRLDRSVVP
jgi:MFS family permease